MESDTDELGLCDELGESEIERLGLSDGDREGDKEGDDTSRASATAYSLPYSSPYIHIYSACANILIISDECGELSGHGLSKT